VNINDMRNMVIAGQIATIKAQIETWNIYAARTGETVTNIITALNDHIAKLTILIK